MERHREYNIKSYLLFVNFVKAFDAVAQTELWETGRKGISYTFNKNNPKYEPK
jgi:hypothetical protein